MLEAQALGTLAVASNVKSGPAEIVLNGEAGCLFEPHNPEDLARVLNFTVSSPDECSAKICTAISI